MTDDYSARHQRALFEREAREAARVLEVKSYETAMVAEDAPGWEWTVASATVPIEHEEGSDEDVMTTDVVAARVAADQAAKALAIADEELIRAQIRELSDEREAQQRQQVADWLEHKRSTDELKRAADALEQEEQERLTDQVRRLSADVARLGAPFEERELDLKRREVVAYFGGWYETPPAMRERFGITERYRSSFERPPAPQPKLLS